MPFTQASQALIDTASDTTPSAYRLDCGGMPCDVQFFPTLDRGGLEVVATVVGTSSGVTVYMSAEQISDVVQSHLRGLFDAAVRAEVDHYRDCLGHDRGTPTV